MKTVALRAGDPTGASSSTTSALIKNALAGPGQPAWFARSRDKLSKLLRYGTGPYAVFRQLSSVHDGRRRPRIPASDVLRSLCFTALLRIPSLNSLEGWLKRPGFQRLLGLPAFEGLKSFSSDTVARVLDRVYLHELQPLLPRLIEQAERKKVFRAGKPGQRRVVAIDGWEQFSSYDRHCKECLTRDVTVEDGKRTQYYHRWAVAFLLSQDVEVVLDMEPLLTADRRDPKDNAGDAHEGESTAALRLLDRLHATYGSWLDLFVLDALYASGPFMTRIDLHGYGAIITLKKETDEPFKDFLKLTRDQPPSKRWKNEARGERLVAWDVDDIETLDTFKGKTRVVRVHVRTKGSDAEHVWCAAVIGRAARRPVQNVHRLQRSRWHLENTAFNQWTQYWNLAHVFRHTPNAIRAVMLLWILAFDLLQLFVYRRLRRPRTPRDPCDTIRDIVGQLMADVASLRRRIPWSMLLDTS